MGVWEWIRYRNTESLLAGLDSEEPDEVDLQDPEYVPLTPEEREQKREWAQRELGAMKALGFDNIRKQF